ncbi:MAG: maleylpyruvate isomerase family mycothiol-dependent enzyme [Ilumatobacteraceae bacterium]
MSALDLVECADEYRQCRERIVDLVAGVPADTRVPACPDWTVHDLCAHLAGVTASLVAGQGPGADTQAWVDDHVERRRTRTLDELMAEWVDASPAFEQMIATQGTGVVVLLNDIVAHEHDLRGALDRPGGRDARGVALSLELGRKLMERDLRRNDTLTVEMVADENTWTAGTGPTTLRLDLRGRPDATWELFRVFGSRRSPAQLDRLPWGGEWRAVEHDVFHLPLPAYDLDDA